MHDHVSKDEEIPWKHSGQLPPLPSAWRLVLPGGSAQSLPTISSCPLKFWCNNHMNQVFLNKWSYTRSSQRLQIPLICQSTIPHTSPSSSYVREAVPRSWAAECMWGDKQSWGDSPGTQLFTIGYSQTKSSLLLLERKKYIRFQQTFTASIRILFIIQVSYTQWL